MEKVKLLSFYWSIQITLQLLDEFDSDCNLMLMKFSFYILQIGILFENQTKVGFLFVGIVSRVYLQTLFVGID